MSMSRKFACGLLAVGAPLATTGALALASSSSAATHDAALPKLTLTANGSALTVSGPKQSGAVDVHQVVSGESHASFIVGRLDPGITYKQVFKTLPKIGKDPNAVEAVGAIVFANTAPMGTSNVQTVLRSGKYIALDVTGKKAPRIAKFTITKSSSPAKLPKASATTHAIEFAFRGSTRLKRGTLVRGVNNGWLVHMNDFQGVKSKADGKKLIAGFKAGKPFKTLRKYENRSFFSLFDPVSHGAVQQMVLKAKPGYYVEACFMKTQDGRFHTQLGMERLVKVVK
jgi:hypothetical protein